MDAITLAGNNTVSGILNVSNGTIQNALTIAPNAVLNWSGGILNGAVTVASNAVMNVTGSANKLVQAYTDENGHTAQSDAEIAAAGKRGFKAIELPVRLHAHVESVVRPFQSPNVVGILPGADTSGKDQAVLYTAHFDHLGFVPGMSGDNIYNGAADNATGCGMLLEIARAWAALSSSW